MMSDDDTRRGGRVVMQRLAKPSPGDRREGSSPSPSAQIEPRTNAAVLNDMECKIVTGAQIAHERCSLLAVADIAYAADVSQSTVRKYLPGLIRSRHLGYTSYVRYFKLGPEGHTHGGRNA